MKRAASLLLAAALLLTALTACRGPAAESEPPAAGSESPASQSPTALEVVNAVFPFCGFDASADVEHLTADEGGGEFLTTYIENAYGLAAGTWEDAAVIRATGASAFELAVLRMADSSAAVQAASALMNYIFNRQGDFSGYAPAEADMVANGSINQDGPYAALFICPDTVGADTAFAAAVNGNFQFEPEEVEADVGAMLDYLLDVCRDAPDGLERLDSGDVDALADYIKTAYGLNREQWEEAAIARGTGASAFELAVLQVSDDENWDIDVTQLLNQYLDEREELFAGDAPDQAELLHQAEVHFITGETIGAFIILPVCENPDQAVNLGLAMEGVNRIGSMGRSRPQSESRYDPDWSDRIAFVPPNEDDMSIYDTSAIRAACEAGDPSGLSGYDRDIYNAAQKVLFKVLTNGMSDLEKETALYSWVVNNVNYDWTHQDIMAITPRESFTPYGGLVNHTAVCLGYATSFQLLCDLAGVECITVVGAAFQSTGDHAWNMVRLNGAWYCVDVTWDANQREQIGRGSQRDWDYFNITSDEMAVNHQWDYANTPEAVTEGNGRG